MHHSSKEYRDPLLRETGYIYYRLFSSTDAEIFTPTTSSDVAQVTLNSFENILY